MSDKKKKKVKAASLLSKLADIEAQAEAANKKSYPPQPKPAEPNRPFPPQPTPAKRAQGEVQGPPAPTKEEPSALKKVNDFLKPGVDKILGAPAAINKALQRPQAPPAVGKQKTLYERSVFPHIVDAFTDPNEHESKYELGDKKPVQGPPMPEKNTKKKSEEDYGPPMPKEQGPPIPEQIRWEARAGKLGSHLDKDGYPPQPKPGEPAKPEVAPVKVKLPEVKPEVKPEEAPVKKQQYESAFKEQDRTAGRAVSGLVDDNKRKKKKTAMDSMSSGKTIYNE